MQGTTNGRRRTTGGATTGPVRDGSNAGNRTVGGTVEQKVRSEKGEGKSERVGDGARMKLGALAIGIILASGAALVSRNRGGSRA